MSNYKRIFLDGHSYYITMVTYRRAPLLIENIDLLRESFKRSKQRYAFGIDAIIILPDHLHMIITPENPDEYPKIISHIKRSFVYGLDKTSRDHARMGLSRSSYQRKLAGIWQKRYYEHTIRDQKDWDEKAEYIRHNAVKHGLVEAWNDWKFSSFA